MNQQRMSHVFVEEIPAAMEQGVLYVSMECATAIHLCACGCRQEVVTPLSPTDWSLTFDGEHVSLDHSIGNGSLPCRSHYFIHGGAIAWADDLSDADIERSRSRDRRNKAAYFSRRDIAPSEPQGTAPVAPLSQITVEPSQQPATVLVRAGIWAALKGWWKG